MDPLTVRGRLEAPPGALPASNAQHGLIGQARDSSDLDDETAALGDLWARTRLDAVARLMHDRFTALAETVVLPAQRPARVNRSEASQAENAGSIPVIRSKPLFGLAEQGFSTCIDVFWSCIYFLRLPRFAVDFVGLLSQR